MMRNIRNRKKILTGPASRTKRFVKKYDIIASKKDVTMMSLQMVVIINSLFVLNTTRITHV